MNAVINEAIRSYFANFVESDDFDRLVNSVRDRYRVALDKLADS